MELINLDIAIFVFIDLVEAVLESKSSLKEHLDQMIKDLVLGVGHLAFLIN